MRTKTIFWSSTLLLCNILNCSSFSPEIGVQSNFEFNEAENVNKVSRPDRKWIGDEIETWKPVEEQNDEATETNFQNLGFTGNVENCVKSRQYEITSDYKRGKTIILNCVKEAVIINFMQYLTASQNFSISFFNGLFEIAKVPDPLCGAAENLKTPNYCNSNYIKNIEDLKRDRWTSKSREMYRNSNNTVEADVDKLKNRISDEEQLSRIEMQQNKFLLEVIRSFSDENYWRKKEMEELKREINDSALLNTIDALTWNYMLKIKYFPGATAKIRRGNSNKIIFDLDIEEQAPSEKEDEEDEEFTNEVEENWRQGRLDYSSESEESESSQQGNKKKKKKRKKESRGQRKQGKKIKKHLSFLAIPIMIQLALLPFVLKKLFFLAIGALTAGKLALILVLYRLLRNLKVHDENYNLRLEHYGYKAGEEYGAWVNGRRFGRSFIDSLSEAPFVGGNVAKSR